MWTLFDFSLLTQKALMTQIAQCVAFVWNLTIIVSATAPFALSEV